MANYVWKEPVPMPEITEQEGKDGKYYEWNETLYQSDNTKGWELKTFE